MKRTKIAKSKELISNLTMKRVFFFINTWGFDNSMLIGFGGVTVARPISEPLHHFRVLPQTFLHCLDKNDGEKESN